MGTTNGQNVDIPPEELRETMSAVITAMDSSTALGNQCLGLIEDLMGAAFRGPAASMAVQTISEINADLQKITTHGTWLAEHLGKTADVMESNEDDSINAIRAVHGG
ncbi:hypothetical protein MCHIJ_15880 [Mycolicibacterium chitae]|uniref:ESAT-6 like protein EsxD n=1 Tax=Mycolicibacterium chitae TaxID=1792 RepID=A0A448HW58_MYCCI|nr:hypothetical protein [Mycolicibacterium chitae]MCV7107287.1 hypothetical protein [Mycolicibacterium chitae]BBZ02151.1 hypothetical protein MCHIJ_15880 [Mycolicibacterium chitae]VEG44161.1 ESAT-6 like protein EsxD [Mycolicibacterium chitae]